MTQLQQPAFETCVRAVQIPGPEGPLHGDLALPADPSGIVVFAHGSGSSRKSPRNRFVAHTLHQAGLATLLMDLLSEREEACERAGGLLRFDVERLSQRLHSATTWLANQTSTSGLRVAYFGASTGAAAALIAGAAQPQAIAAIVCRGGRPDLAGARVLAQVRAPCLFIVGGDDPEVLDLNRSAYAQLSCERALEVVSGASHLFEEPGTLEEVARLARAWFVRWLAPAHARAFTKGRSS